MVLGFAHDWANREATMRSWELVARYVIPELNGYTAGLRESQEYLNRHQAELMAGASKAVVSKILANDKAAAAMQTTMEQAAQAAAAKEEPSSRSSAPAAASPPPSTDSVVCVAVLGGAVHRVCTQTWRSVVFEGDGVGGDVHLRLVLGQLDDTTLGTKRITELGATGVARAVEVLDDIAIASGAAELHACRR